MQPTNWDDFQVFWTPEGQLYRVVISRSRHKALGDSLREPKPDGGSLMIIPEIKREFRSYHGFKTSVPGKTGVAHRFWDYNDALLFRLKYA